MDRKYSTAENFFFGYIPFTAGPIWLIYLMVMHSNSWIARLAPGPLLVMWAGIFLIGQLYIFYLETAPRKEPIAFISICTLITFINLFITPLLLGCIFKFFSIFI